MLDIKYRPYFIIITESYDTLVSNVSL